MMEKCTWEYISADAEYGFQSDGPPEDSPSAAGWRYCPFCGKEIEEC